MILSKQKKLEFIRTSGNAGVLFWLFFLERFPVFLVGDFIFLRIFIVKCFQLIHEGGVLQDHLPGMEKKTVGLERQSNV